MYEVHFRLYLITDDETAREPDVVAAALGALPRGLAAVQLRAKGLGGRALLAAAATLREVTARHGAPLFINDRVNVALAVGADGVHLPVAGLAPEDARAVGPRLAIGASTHSLAEARAAVERGAHFVTFGPVWDTPSKARYGDPVGLGRLLEAAAALPVPVFALGGIDADRAAACAVAGARVACIRAVLGADDPGAAALDMARHAAWVD